MKKTLFLLFMFFFKVAFSQDYYSKLRVDSSFTKGKTTYYFYQRKRVYYVAKTKNHVDVTGKRSRYFKDFDLLKDSVDFKTFSVDSLLIDLICDTDVPLVGFGELKNNDKNGKWYFFETYSHKLHSTCEFSEGEKEGEQVLYFDNLQLGTIFNYSKDKKHGKYYAYDIKGKLVEEGEFNNGDLVYYTHYFGKKNLFQKLFHFY